MQKTAGVDAATTWACLPRHVQAEILLRLPAFHLRRLRRVCKLWRDIIITDARKLRPRRAPTHTIAFYKGCDAGAGGVAETPGHGFLFDEQWRLAARFTVDRSATLLGTCNTLFCFFHEHDDIKVVDPLSGASIRVPLSQAKHGSKTGREYCFGFDSTTRQYKIVHVHRYKFGAPPSSKDSVFVEKELYVHTVGADKQGWRAVRVDTAKHGTPYNKDGGFVEKNPACGDGAVYWLGITAGGASKNARFDLATEEITSADEPLLQVRGQMPATQICCRYRGAKKLGLCGIQITWYGEWEDGCWPRSITGLPHKITGVRYNISHHRLGRLFGRRLPGAHALQRGHLLLQEPNGTLYAHEIGSSSACMTELRLVGKKKLLVYTAGPMEEPAEWYKFVPLTSQRPRLMYPRWHNTVSTFAYTPTLPPAGSYALHFGSSNVLPL